MTLVDKVVKHKQFGIGIIVYYDEKDIYVNFPNREDADRFRYPICMGNSLVWQTTEDLIKSILNDDNDISSLKKLNFKCNKTIVNEKIIRSLFSKYGIIKQLYFEKNAKFNDLYISGFVEMEDAFCAIKACKYINGIKINNSIIIIDEYEKIMKGFGWCFRKIKKKPIMNVRNINSHHQRHISDDDDDDYPESNENIREIMGYGDKRYNGQGMQYVDREIGKYGSAPLWGEGDDPDEYEIEDK